MKTSLDCLPGLLRQATEAIRLGAKDDQVDIMVVRELLLASTTLDFDQPPPQLSGALQAQLREITGCAAPYREAKQRFNQLAPELLPPLARAISSRSTPTPRRCSASSV